MVIIPTMTITDRMARHVEIPALLIAVNSKYSPKFPNVIKEESKTAKGSATGTVIKLKKTKSLA
jgi:hypothetical protein